MTPEQNGKLYEAIEKNFPLDYEHADEFDKTTMELNGSFQVQVDSNEFIQLYNPAILVAREELIQLMSDEINALEN